MFSSPCSLRSTQCATLIALATAAGISRTEQPPANNASAPATPQSVHSDNFFAAQPRAYRLAATAPAPWLRPASVAATQAPPNSPEIAPVADPTHDTSPPSCAAAPDATLAPFPPALATVSVFFAPPAPTLSTPKHSLPFAIGPPRCGTPTRLRAAGTELPGDSPASRSQISRIATVPILIFRARSAPSDKGPTSARSRSSPSSALRGANRKFPPTTPASVRAFARPRGARPVLFRHENKK